MRPFSPRVLPVESLAYRSERLWVGSFRCAPSSEWFADSGPASAHLFVFPRTSVLIQHRGRAPFVSGPNVVTFYNPGDEYRRDAVSAQGDCCEWFAVAPELAAEVAGAMDPRAAERPGRAFRFTHGPSDPPAYLEQRLAWRRAECGEADPLYMEETALHVLARVLRAAYAARGGKDGTPAGAEPLRPRQRELANAAERLLAERFSEPLSLADMARALGSSTYHLCRTFQRVTGRPMHAYRNQLRLRRSLEMLLDGRAEITDVALELGYSSHSHFSFAFRRAFGVTPAAFRRVGGGGQGRRLWPVASGSVTPSSAARVGARS